MGFNLGLLAGVFYARQMGAQPNNRFKKHYEKCRNSNHQKNVVRMYGWRLGHLYIAALLLYLQYLLYIAVPQEICPQQSFQENVFQNSSEVSRNGQHIHLRASLAINHTTSNTLSPTLRFRSSTLVLQVLLGVFVLWMLTEAQFTVVAIDRKFLTVSHFRLFRIKKQRYSVAQIREVQMTRKGTSRFSEQTQHFNLQLIVEDHRRIEVEINQSISSIVIKRRYIELVSFLGREVDVDSLDKLIVDCRANR